MAKLKRVRIVAGISIGAMIMYSPLALYCLRHPLSDVWAITIMIIGLLIMGFVPTFKIKEIGDAKVQTSEH